MPAGLLKGVKIERTLQGLELEPHRVRAAGRFREEVWIERTLQGLEIDPLPGLPLIKKNKNKGRWAISAPRAKHRIAQILMKILLYFIYS